MRVDYNTALRAFARLPGKFKSAYFHPHYVASDAARDPQLEPAFFVYEDGGEIFYHAAHIAKVGETGFSDIQSPYAYGGPLFSTIDPDFLTRAWLHYLAWCRDNHMLAEFVRFHPLLENWRCFPGKTRYERQTVWIDVQGKDLFSSYCPRVRTAIRKAVKNGLQVEWVNTPASHQEFVRLYIEAMNHLKADQFYFFPSPYFQGLQGWEQSLLALCLKEGEVLGAALFLKETHIMEYHLAATSPQGRQYNAASLLLHEAASLARRLGCQKLHLGGGTDNRPDNPLLFFKSGFSPHRASFIIGKLVHAPEPYQRLREEWHAQYGEYSDKVLFYRLPQN